MSHSTPRWMLFGPTTNSHGVTHFTLACRGLDDPRDYHELAYVLKCRFGAVETGELVGPYSMHQFFKVKTLEFVLTLDDPGLIPLSAKDKRHTRPMKRFVKKLLGALNDPETIARSY